MATGVGFQDARAPFTSQQSGFLFTRGASRPSAAGHEFQASLAMLGPATATGGISPLLCSVPARGATPPRAPSPLYPQPAAASLPLFPSQGHQGLQVAGISFPGGAVQRRLFPTELLVQISAAAQWVRVPSVPPERAPFFPRLFPQPSSSVASSARPERLEAPVPSAVAFWLSFLPFTGLGPAVN